MSWQAETTDVTASVHDGLGADAVVRMVRECGWCKAWNGCDSVSSVLCESVRGDDRRKCETLQYDGTDGCT